jgi:lipoyl(octanoyl) transferase
MNITTWPALTPYAEGMQRMDAALSHALATGEETAIFCEHEPILTIGTSGNESDLGTSPLPFLHTGRGGKVTYHGPGQRVVYLVINLKRFNSDIRAYVQWLQTWLIATLAEANLTATAGAGDEIGVWVNNKKIAAIGVRVRKGYAYHGIALNLNPDLSVYKNFIPCGITEKGVTSLHAESQPHTMDELDTLLTTSLNKLLPPLPEEA